MSVNTSLTPAPAIATLALKVAATEFDSGWQALAAARRMDLSLPQRAYFMRVAADEFRHSRAFDRLGVAASGLEAGAYGNSLEGGRLSPPNLFADFVVGEIAAGAAFWLYRRARVEMAATMPEFEAIQRDEAFHRFGALYHLRRMCRDRQELSRLLLRARLRLVARGARVGLAFILSGLCRVAATLILLLLWPLLRGRALARLRDAGLDK